MCDLMIERRIAYSARSFSFRSLSYSFLMPRCFETQVWDSCVTPCREVSYCPNNFSRVYVFLDFCEFSSCNQGMVWNGMERKFWYGIWKMPE